MPSALTRLRWPLLLCASVALCGDGGWLPAACYGEQPPAEEFTDPIWTFCLTVEVGGMPSFIPCRFTWTQRYSDGARVLELDGTNGGPAVPLTFAASFEFSPGALSGTAAATGLDGVRQASGWGMDAAGLRYALGSFVAAGSQDPVWYGSGTVQESLAPLHGNAHLVLDPFSASPDYQPGPPGTTLTVDVTF